MAAEQHVEELYRRLQEGRFSKALAGYAERDVEQLAEDISVARRLGSTPADLVELVREHPLRHKVRGYSRREVDDVLQTIASELDAGAARTPDEQPLGVPPDDGEPDDEPPSMRSALEGPPHDGTRPSRRLRPFTQRDDDALPLPVDEASTRSSDIPGGGPAANESDIRRQLLQLIGVRHTGRSVTQALRDSGLQSPADALSEPLALVERDLLDLARRWWRSTA